MSENEFEPCTLVKHVHPGFSRIKMYVVKKVDDARYKCRYLQGDVFMSDEFEGHELERYVEKPVKRIRSVMG